MTQSSKLEAWSYWFKTVLLLKPDDIQISFHFLWLKKPYRHLLKAVEVVNSRSVQCHHSTKEKEESSQILVTGKNNVTYTKYFFFFYLLILESSKPFSDGSKIFIVMVTWHLPPHSSLRKKALTEARVNNQLQGSPGIHKHSQLSVKDISDMANSLLILLQRQYLWNSNAGGWGNALCFGAVRITCPSSTWAKQATA